MSDIENRIAEVLAAHEPHPYGYDGQYQCTCGATPTGDFFYPGEFAAHQTSVLAPFIREAQAVALEEAADELNPRGEKPGAYSNWLRARATQLRSSDE